MIRFGIAGIPLTSKGRTFVESVGLKLGFERYS